jgi:hypothetical protein
MQKGLDNRAAADISIRELNEERWDIERRLRMYVWNLKY